MPEIPSISIPIGGVWEQDEWQVEFNCPGHAYRSKYKQTVDSVPGGRWSPWSSAPCPHATDIVDTEPEHFPSGMWNGSESWQETRDWVVPRVVVARNEAGHSTTGVCLDCILEWGAANA